MKMVRVEIIMNEIKMDRLLEALKKFKVSGVTVYKAQGCGVQYGTPEYEDPVRGSDIKLLEKTVVMLVMPQEDVDKFIKYIEKNLYTGHIGDGKIFVSEVVNAYRVRTGEEGYEALVAGTL